MGGQPADVVLPVASMVQPWTTVNEFWYDGWKTSSVGEHSAAEMFIDKILSRESASTESEGSEDRDTDEWILCHRVNLHFYVVDDNNYDCLACKQNVKPVRGQRRTDFLQRVLCSTGHDAHFADNKGLCSDCDTEMILNISKRKQQCFYEGCSKLLTIDEPLLKWSLQRHRAPKALLDAYLKIVKDHAIFDCIACCESISIYSDLCPTRTPTIDCMHDIDMCTLCFHEHLRSSIKPKQFERVRCPSNRCNQLLTRQDVKDLAPKDLFQGYEHGAFLTKISTDPYFRWCTNPSDCNSGQLHPPADDDPCWTCTKCKFKSCFIEKIPWHEDQNCEQFQLSKQFDGLSMQEIRRTTKKCPKAGCGARIEKVSGCKDMKCKKKCQRTFCWSCKVIYDEAVAAGGRSQHLAGCVHKCDGWASVVARPGAEDPLYAKDWDVDPGYEGR